VLSLDLNTVYVVLKEYTGMNHNITYDNFIGVYTSKEAAYKVKSELEAAYKEDILVIESSIDKKKLI